MPKSLRAVWIAPTRATVMLLGALALPRVGVATIRRFAAQTPTASMEALSLTEVAAAAGIAAPGGTDMDRAKRDVFELVERCEELGVEVISVADPDYPVRLK